MHSSPTSNDNGQPFSVTLQMEEHITPPLTAESRNNEHHFAAPPAGELELQQIDSVTAAVRGLLLVLALSFHSIFKGMAISLHTTTKDVWGLFMAVMLHELAIMFCIGNNWLSKSRIHNK